MGTLKMIHPEKNYPFIFFTFKNIGMVTFVDHCLIDTMRSKFGIS